MSCNRLRLTLGGLQGLLTGHSNRTIAYDLRLSALTARPQAAGAAIR